MKSWRALELALVTRNTLRMQTIVAAFLLATSSFASAENKPATTESLGPDCKGKSCKQTGAGMQRKFATVPVAHPIHHLPPPDDAGAEIDTGNIGGSQ